MEKGLSPFQKDILAALKKWPSLERQPPGGDLSAWARPRDILRALGRPSTAATRAGVAKALARLCEHGAAASTTAQMESSRQVAFLRPNCEPKEVNYFCSGRPTSRQSRSCVTPSPNKRSGGRSRRTQGHAHGCVLRRPAPLVYLSHIIQPAMTLAPTVLRGGSATSPPDLGVVNRRYGNDQSHGKKHKTQEHGKSPLARRKRPSQAQIMPTGAVKGYLFH